MNGQSHTGLSMDTVVLNGLSQSVEVAEMIRKLKVKKKPTQQITSPLLGWSG